MNPLGNNSRNKFPATAFLLWVTAMLVYLAYRLWGTSLIDDAYDQRSVTWLNNALAGRSAHAVDFYYHKADSLVQFTVKLLLALSLIPLSHALVNRLAEHTTETTRHAWTLTSTALALNTFAVFTFINFPAYRYYFVTEDSVVENLSAGVFFCAFLLGFLLLLSGQVRRRSGTAWPMILTGFGLAGFLDEVSFGERLLHFNAPVIHGIKLDGIHDLGDLTISWLNGVGTSWRIALLLLLVGTLGILSVAILRFGKVHWKAAAAQRNAPVRLFVLAFVVLVAFSQVIDMSLFVSDETPVHMQATEELLELNAGLALLFGCLVIFRQRRTQEDLPDREPARIGVGQLQG